jgi:hypothetical protein
VPFRWTYLSFDNPSFPSRTGTSVPYTPYPIRTT